MSAAENQAFLDLFIAAEPADPHLARRRDILRAHPEVKQLEGFDPRSRWVLMAVVTTQLALGWWVSTFESPWAVVALAYVVGCPLANWLALGIHECAHGLVSPTRLGNRAWSLFTNLPLVLPAAGTALRYHWNHHLFLGTEEKDNDLPSAFEVRHFNGSAWRKAAWLVVYFFFAATARSFAEWKGRRDVPDRFQVLNGVVQGVAMSAVVYAWGWAPVAYLLLSGVFVFGVHPVGFYLLHGHYQFQAQHQETNSYYGPINLIGFNIGYHTEHHDFPTISGLRLPKLTALAPEFYRSRISHTSWLKLLWQFVVDPQVGHHSRLVRPLAQRAKGNASPAPPYQSLETSSGVSGLRHTATSSMAP